MRIWSVGAVTVGLQGERLAELGVEENGYPIAFCEGYMAVMPSINLRTYADLCETYAFEEERLSPAARSLVLREPEGSLLTQSNKLAVRGSAVAPEPLSRAARWAMRRSSRWSY